MNATLQLGGKVRALRRREGWSQIQLAQKLEISASYLNLIEHDQRPLTASLLVKVAQTFNVDLQSFADESQSRLINDLQEVFGDVLFEEHPLMSSDLRELAGNAPVSQAIVSLYRAYRSATESTQALASKIFDGRDFLGVNPAHLPSEEVSDVIQKNMNYFGELEAAAEDLVARAKLDRNDLYRSMVDYLHDEHGIDVVLDASRKAVRRFDPERRRLALSDAIPARSRIFQLAHQIGLLAAQPVLDSIILRSHLTTPESVTLCRVALANSFAAAILMPYAELLRAAEEMRYDVELLGQRFGVSFEQVCHRLTTLRRPGASGVPFHFVRVDIAGNISKRFSGTGIHFARFSGSCPRWDVHAAFLTPGRVRTQLSKMPDGTAYFCVARTVRKNYGGYGSPETLMAVGIGCPVREAKKLVYSDGYDLENLDAAVPIGTTCRLCERMDCEQRAFPSLQHGLTIDQNVRGMSFYAPAVTEPPAKASENVAVRSRGRKRATS
ncbi:MAG TPA: short-chain fatty acyl-CoA regulator family protein [Thermoanaerobaculia bacterium]|nr:short-chain fatty acyl-CoA regulator family protein [Thermoanaerobaculia bacterium]